MHTVALNVCALKETNAETQQPKVMPAGWDPDGGPHVKRSLAACLSHSCDFVVIVLFLFQAICIFNRDICVICNTP